MDPKQHLRLPAGSLVCVAVVNGNPLNYGYSLSVSIDSSGPVFPDLSKQVKLLSTLYPAPAQPNAAPPPPGGHGVAAAPAPADTAAKIQALVTAVSRLESDLIAARKVAMLADKPEPLSQVDNFKQAQAGLRFAQDSILNMSKDPGRFNDPKLKDTIDKLVSAAKDAVGDDERGKVTVTALNGYADALRSERDQIATAFARASDMPEACGKVGRGISTMSLAVVKKDSSMKVQRGTTTDFAFQIVNEAPYDRPLVSIAPVALAAAAPGAPEFVVDNGVLRDAGTRAHFRAGAIVALNRYAGGPFNLFGTSFGLGLASQGAKQIISDVFGAVLLSVGDVVGLKSDILRIGLGAGASYQADIVTGYTVGQPYPTSAGPLEDKVQKAWKPALYLVFTLPSLNIGSAQ